jgi:hypothetical protein
MHGNGREKKVRGVECPRAGAYSIARRRKRSKAFGHDAARSLALAFTAPAPYTWACILFSGKLSW